MNMDDGMKTEFTPFITKDNSGKAASILEKRIRMRKIQSNFIKQFREAVHNQQDGTHLRNHSQEV